MPLNNTLARLRNVLAKVSLKRRKGEAVEIVTKYGKVYELRELKPYGLASKPKSGKGLCLFVGGDSRSPILLALDSRDGEPDLEEGESALYSEYDNSVVLRKDGSLELNGKDLGGLVKWAELESQLSKVNTFLDGIRKAVAGAGVAPSDGGATLKTNLIGAMKALELPDYSQVENEKVQHGEGGIA